MLDEDEDEDDAVTKDNAVVAEQDVGSQLRSDYARKRSVQVRKDAADRKRAKKSPRTSENCLRTKFDSALKKFRQLGKESKPNLMEESLKFIPDPNNSIRGNAVCQACNCGIQLRTVPQHCFGKIHCSNLRIWKEAKTKNAILEKHVIDGERKYDVGISIPHKTKMYRIDVLSGLFQSNICVKSFQHFSPIMDKVLVFFPIFLWCQMLFVIACCCC